MGGLWRVHNLHRWLASLCAYISQSSKVAGCGTLISSFCLWLKIFINSKIHWELVHKQNIDVEVCNMRHNLILYNVDFDEFSPLSSSPSPPSYPTYDLTVLSIMQHLFPWILNSLWVQVDFSNNEIHSVHLITSLRLINQNPVWTLGIPFL